MKRIVITFGLISGGISILLMLATLPLVGRVSYEYLTVLGYTGFIASFLMVFFCIARIATALGGGNDHVWGKAFQGRDPDHAGRWRLFTSSRGISSTTSSCRRFWRTTRCT